MLKSFALLSILVVAAPSLAVAADNQKNNSNSQNPNSLSFTANDPPAANFNSNGPPSAANDPPPANSNSKGRPAGFPPVPGCTNGQAVGNPHCQPASP